MSCELKEKYEERAAIMEYDGKMPREQAEKLAELEIYHKKSGENHD